MPAFFLINVDLMSVLMSVLCCVCRFNVGLMSVNVRLMSVNVGLMSVDAGLMRILCHLV